MRLIRPLYVARLLALLIAFGIVVPTVGAEAATTKKKTSSRSAARKPAYSASASQARKASQNKAPVHGDKYMDEQRDYCDDETLHDIEAP